MGLKLYNYKDLTCAPKGSFSLPLAFLIPHLLLDFILGLPDSEEVAISQIFPLNLSWAKVKKLNEPQFYLKFFGEIFEELIFLQYLGRSQVKRK